MGIVFVATGLGLLAGGAYAVIEGWPYLLIERGFTLVIVGVVLMTAGVLMLALSRVLAELRRIRGQLSNAVMALSVASVGQGLAGQDPAGREPAGRGRAPGAGPDHDGGRQGDPTAIGAAVLAGGALSGGALAAGVALARGRPAPDKPDDQAAEPDPRDGTHRDEPGLVAFSDPAGHANPEERVGIDGPLDPAATAMSQQAMAGEAEPWAQHSWPETGEGARSAPPGEPERPADAALDGFETALLAATREAQKQESEPEQEPEREPEPESEPPHGLENDLDRLRGRLALATGGAGEDFEAAPGLVAERRERADADLASADDWMTSVSPARERWFSEPVPVEVAAEPDPAGDREPEPDMLPVWPPQAREAASFDPDSPYPEAGHGGPAHQEVAGSEPPQPEADPGTSPIFTLETERAPPDPDEPRLDEPVETPPPAASDEGVIGAYQVGATYFTLYADGSIQARTPEGDYSFASMDELKTYLASEKSRIGA